MTLVLGWQRVTIIGTETWLASDSRLGGGESWDCCPKILQLPRSDALLAFAGVTNRAYPLMLQVARAIDAQPDWQDRSLPLEVLAHEVLRIINQMAASVTDLPAGLTRLPPEEWDVQFVLAGVPWDGASRALYEYRYAGDQGAFAVEPVTPSSSLGGHGVSLLGDVTGEARARLERLLGHGAAALQDQPMAVLRDMLDSESFSSIGGAPQVGVVYPYLQSKLLPVLWKGAVHIGGRPLDPQSMERHSGNVYDPQSLQSGR